MLKTYKARLTSDHLEWLETPPPSTCRERLVDVSFEIEDEALSSEKSSARAIAALQKLSDMGGLEHVIPDPVVWQREIREDRILPGREE